MDGPFDPPEHPKLAQRRTRRSSGEGGFAFAAVHLRQDFESYVDRLETANPEYVFGWDVGREYLRLWKSLRGQRSRSAVAFVDRYANVYRADSWRQRGRMLAPASEMLLASGRDRSLRAKPTRRQQEFISRKIRTLHHEGYPQDQAIAIAYRMAGVPPRATSGARRTRRDEARSYKGSRRARD